FHSRIVASCDVSCHCCWFLHCPCRPCDLHSFPTRRSSDLADCGDDLYTSRTKSDRRYIYGICSDKRCICCKLHTRYDRCAGSGIDRKSTRLNSSHVSISYAVFCLKKKQKSLNLTSGSR